jgi:predicted enzyme related to lactoylglutathione lyase
MDRRHSGAAVKFYGEAFGMKVKTRYSDSLVQLDNEGPAYVLQKIASDGSTPREPCSVIGFESKDLEATARAVDRLGARSVTAPAPCPPGRFIALHSPEGVPHEVIQFAQQ